MTQKDYAEKIILALKAIEKQTERSNDENTPTKKSKRCWDKFGVIGLWVAAAVAIIAIYVTNKDTQDSIIAANRGWIAPESVQFSIPIEADQTPKVVVTYQNIGRSPAVDVKIGVGPVAIPLTAPLKSTEIWPETPFWKLMETPLQEKCAGNEPMSGSAVVYPSNRIEGSVEKEMTGIWNPAVKAAVLAANQIVIVAGCFTYQTMNRTFHTGFCKYFYPLIGQPSTTWPAKSCPVGNFDK